MILAGLFLIQFKNLERYITHEYASLKIIINQFPNAINAFLLIFKTRLGRRLEVITVQLRRVSKDLRLFRQDLHDFVLLVGLLVKIILTIIRVTTAYARVNNLENHRTQSWPTRKEVDGLSSSSDIRHHLPNDGDKTSSQLGKKHISHLHAIVLIVLLLELLGKKKESCKLIKKKSSRRQSLRSIGLVRINRSYDITLEFQ